jgi:hypothetical protein
VGDVLADLAVAARGAALQDAVAVDERDGQPVDLRLGDEAERGSSMPSRRRWLRMRSIQPRSSSSLRALASENSGCRWRTFSSRETGVAPTRCVGESGVDQLGVLGLEAAQLVEQRVVLVVADLGVVEDVVALVVVGELLAQLGARCSAPPGSPTRSPTPPATRGAPGRTARGGPGRPTSVRSKCSGRDGDSGPVATAARSCPAPRGSPGQAP